MATMMDDGPTGSSTQLGGTTGGGDNASNNNNNNAENNKNKMTDNIGAAVPLAFPSSAYTDPTPQLAPLRDNHSAYPAVAKACLALNQYAMNGSSSSSTMDDVSSVESSSVFHDSTYATSMSGAFASLIECIQTHDDRRAKIVACKTLALVARACYARIRHSPHLFAMRDSTITRLEDEVGTDVPMALCTVALDDPDDGVSASALEALGIMALSASSTPGTLVEDELLQEIMSIVNTRISPYSPTLANIQDEEPNIAQTELQTRIYENVMSPRLLQIVCRVTAMGNDYSTGQHISQILPILTSSLVHLSKTSPPLIYGMDRNTYAKRWVELDFVSLINDVVEVLLLPAMHSGVDASLSYSAAMSSIRLAHACPHAPWVPEIVHWTNIVLMEEFRSQADNSLEAKMTCMASLLICSRAVPFPDRSPTLLFVFEQLTDLPSTTMTPHGLHSPGLLLEYRGFLHYRKPARIAFLTEIALSFFKDGPIESVDTATTTRSSALERFLKSPSLLASLKEIQTGVTYSVRDEVVTTFCTVATKIGRSLRSPPDGGGDKSTHLVVLGSQEDFESWVRMSLQVLSAFSGCVNWGASSAYMDENLSMTIAAQASYTCLVQELLHAVGLLNTTSVSLKMSPMAAPPNLLWDQMEESSSYLGRYEAVMGSTDKSLLGRVTKMMESLIKKELKGSGTTSHHMRLFVLALSADQWVQGRYGEMKKQESGGGGQGTVLDTGGAAEILTALSPRRVFTKVVEGHKSQIEGYSKKKKEMYKKHAQDTVTASVASIENIALLACEWRKRFGSSTEVKNVLNQAVLSLQGKTGGNDTGEAQVLPVCQAAIDRIQAAFSSNDPPIDGGAYSPLLGDELKRRPVVTASRSSQSRDQYNEGYLVQLTRQIIACRIDRCILSTPAVYSFQGSARKQNWLRLALPPLPPSRNPQSSISSIPKSSWGTSVSSSSGGSDAAAMAVAYSYRRTLRYDGEAQFRIMVVLRVNNITAVEIPEGIRLEMGVIQESALGSLDGKDPTSIDIMKSLADGSDGLKVETELSSAVTVYKQELKSGDHITWEIMLDILPMSGPMTLQPSIVYRGMEDEPAHASLIGAAKDGDGDGTSVVSGVSVQSERTLDAGDGKEGDEKKMNITIPGEPMKLSPLVGLQPCPLVFLRDGCGDIDTFRFLWSRMPFQVPPLKVSPIEGPTSKLTPFDAMRLAVLSTLRFAGESIPGGDVTKLWAFSSLRGRRVLFVLAESDSESSDNKDISSTEKTIHVRGDDKVLLSCLAGTATSRRALIAAIGPGLQPT